MTRFINFFLLALVCAGLLSCGDETEIDDPSFSKIYDHSQADISFHPIDFTPLTEGLLILAGKENESSTYRGVTLHRVNEDGDYVREIDLSTEYVLPTGKMTLIDSVAYFVAMDPISLEAQLLAVASDYSISATGLNRLFPLAANWNSNNELILLSYDPENLNTELTTFDLAGTATGNASFSIGPGSDVQQNIFDHYVDPVQSGLPFFCGEWSTGEYYFNGFYNYNLSLVFSAADGNASGIVQGQGINGGLSDLMVISGSTFALVGYQFEDVFISPASSLSTGAITSSIDLMQGSVTEFRARTPSAISPINVNGSAFTAIAAETESRQIAIYLYTQEGVLRSIQKIGFLNPFTISSIKTDDENNLLVLGTTYVGGRFERIYLEKISNLQIQNWLN